MKRTWVIGWLSLSALVLNAAGRTVAEWRFDQPDHLQGWRFNEQLKDIGFTNGVLACRAVGRDPILELQTPLDLAASPRQMIEVRLKADADGWAQWFWSNTATGLYGGFSAAKTTNFRVCGDGAWRVYRLLPGWQPEGRIIRLRLDLYDGARFELDYIRIVDLAGPAPVGRAEFNFAESGHGWQWVETETARDPVGWNGGKRRCAAPGLWLSPPLHLDADRQTLATVRLAVNRGTYGTLFFLSETQPGLHRVVFALVADGDEHTYHLDLLVNTNWSGRILALGLQPSDATNCTVNLRSLKVGEAADTPPQLAIRFFDLTDALPRAGAPCEVLAVVRNGGGGSATNVVARLEVPKGVKWVENEPLKNRSDRLGLGEEARFRWTVQAARPGNARFRLTLTAANAETLTGFKTVRFTARPADAKLDYVPKPRPVRGPFEVGAYYFPGWATADRWQWIQRFPERRPVLGWYREGDPAVADWHIQWAVEHGLTFFAYDWYWTQGRRQLEHALHDGYFKARYRHLLKFCLLWANHNPPGTSSLEDCRAVTRHWIENYFRRPEHLTIDGKPVVIIYQPDRLTDDLGSANVKRALDAMREECRRAGLNGLYLTTCVADSGQAQIAAREGYDAITAYTWPGLGMIGDGQFAPFETLVPAYRRKWEQLLAESPLPQVPLLVCGGWDSRPWHGDHGLVRFGRTPDLFKRHLLDAKQFLLRIPAAADISQRTPDGIQRGLTPESAVSMDNAKFNPPKMILIEAWNEWGEGSYIEPHQQFGFGYLDAIREVFTDAPKVHAETMPTDVGLGPYDVPVVPPAKPWWDFETGDEGWTAGGQITELNATNGCLSALTVGNHAWLISPPMQARADEAGAMWIRMRLSPAQTDLPAAAATARVQWRTGMTALTETRQQHFPVRRDGQWHEYRVPVSQNPHWRGTITQVLLAPGAHPGVRADLDFVRLTGAGDGQ